MRTIGITGAGGMLGFHLRAALHARKELDVVPIGGAAFDDEPALRSLIARCDTLVHLAYLIVGSDEDILARNRAVAERLTAAIDLGGKSVHLLFASSTHIERDTAYGASKRACDAHFARWAEARGHTFTSLVLPHVFGEGGRPFHNSVVATFAHQLARGERPAITADGMLELLHAQAAAGEVWKAIETKAIGSIRVEGRAMRVSALLDLLSGIDRDYRDLLIPDFRDPLHLDLFNTYRAHLFPSFYPAKLTLRQDARGSLFEAVKTRHGGQAFLSTTKPGITRGNHYHLRKLERFCVVKGRASIRIRRLFSDEVVDFEVSGDEPAVVDIPTLHTHNITNIAEDELLTLFWAHELFDPETPDTFSEPV